MTLLLQLSRIMVVLKVTVYSSEIFEKVKDVIEQLIMKMVDGLMPMRKI